MAKKTVSKTRPQSTSNQETAEVARLTRQNEGLLLQLGAALAGEPSRPGEFYADFMRASADTLQVVDELLDTQGVHNDASFAYGEVVHPLIKQLHQRMMIASAQAGQIEAVLSGRGKSEVAK